jgi:hypothetical protein
VEEIYNLACPASPLHYQHDPVQTIKTSVHGATEVKVRGNAHYEATITRIPNRGKVSADQQPRLLYAYCVDPFITLVCAVLRPETAYRSSFSPCSTREPFVFGPRAVAYSCSP